MKYQRMRYLNLCRAKVRASDSDTTNAQQYHWSERGRATSFANSDALGRPRRSVLALGIGEYRER